MIISYRYKLKNSDSKKILREQSHATNQIWNFCNQIQKECEDRYRSGAKKRAWPTYWDLYWLTKGSAKELGIHAHTVQEVIKQYIVARDFKRRSVKFRTIRSLGWIPFQKQSRQIRDNQITYKKYSHRWFGNIRRPLPPNVAGGSFVEDARGNWYVCFYVDVDKKIPGEGVIGIDLGLKTLATCSDGRKIDSTYAYRKYDQKLRVSQRAKNKKRIRAIYAKMQAARQDSIHKITSKLAKDNKIIIIGNVNSHKLAKNKKMAKAIFDAGWGMFRSQLAYKVSRHQGVFKIVDESFTTRMCSNCEKVSHNSPKGIGALGIRNWDCSDCGASHDRDVNSALNILKIGLSIQPPIEESRIET